MNEDVVIAGAARTPVGSFNGSLGTLPAHELGEIVLREVLERARVEADEVSEVIMGQILTAGRARTRRGKHPLPPAFRRKFPPGR